MFPCTIDHRDYLLYKKTIRHKPIDPIAWLESQPLYPKVFWKEKQSDTIRATVGASLLFSKIPSISEQTDPNLRFYGGMRFSPSVITKQSVWQGFPSTCFWLPQIELSCKEDYTEIQSYEPDSIIFPTFHSDLDQQLPSKETQLDTPLFSDWQRSVEITLQAIHRKQIDKLVLARQTTIELSHPIPVWRFLSDLMRKTVHSTLFAFQMNPSLCFFGATPELLFKREGLYLTTEALAGTKPKGTTIAEETQFERELLSSVKERREFEFVKQFIENKLLAFTNQGGWEGKDKILKTAHLQHLYNRLHIQLKNPLSDIDLIELLHPTPALGGYPRDTALALLKKIESFDRGWYGAPIGMVSSKQSAFYVAIRSALLKEKKIHLFAGLGIVEGSCPKKEWEELNAKISWFNY